MVGRWVDMTGSCEYKKLVRGDVCGFKGKARVGWMKECSPGSGLLGLEGDKKVLRLDEAELVSVTGDEGRWGNVCVAGRSCFCSMEWVYVRCTMRVAVNGLRERRRGMKEGQGR